MKFNCGLTYEERRAAGVKEATLLNIEVAAGGGWDRWFAWYPVRVGVRDCRWLEYVEYRYTDWMWCIFAKKVVPRYVQYRAIKENTDGNV